MATRQNPIKKFEKLMERAVQAPFAFIFPSKVQPAEVARQLELAMEDNALLQGAGQRLVPNFYDIYLSIKDHQQLAPAQATLIREWQNSLIAYARKKHHTLKTTPIIRLHPDTTLRLGVIRIEAKLEDAKSSAEGGIMATQALSAEQLAQLRAQLPTGQELPGITNAGSSSLNQPRTQSSRVGQPSQPIVPTIPPTTPTPSVPMPVARLTIQVPQSGPQVYRIEKPVVNIGRQLSNDIIVEDKKVSRNHAQIKYQSDGQFTIFDLGSTNGITINGTPHMRQHTLRNGDRFTIGSYDFYFERR